MKTKEQKNIERKNLPTSILGSSLLTHNPWPKAQLGASSFHWEILTSTIILILTVFRLLSFLSILPIPFPTLISILEKRKTSLRSKRLCHIIICSLKYTQFGHTIMYYRHVHCVDK